ncbi:NADH-quinone oxidoreductase subunit NuoG [Pacificimonas flava]|uniref:NADH-quinone oxidoreductase n=1 Tax=Pacificimonas flava TaxID=1234595 RepID=M2U8G5_9SPHN|nr:NADH-quinone oxidoreductase subunit NuoG [Pacificimonas flava]EMD84273.1 NADH-ubiquinone oxidoreductase chain G [Pacificimonas flava]MBB5279851.1 NADH-quinone oxidoreductase subunit G [Pacificimonas flava]
MPKLTVDGIEVEVPQGATVLQACEAAGKEIPRFCYHERLSIAGNCRMCLVEMEKSPKPVASCAMPASDGQVVKTNSEVTRKAREGVMEFLLINHPLDCPICDQGGECDLQDQALNYGRGRSRYQENKRAVTEKYMGPIIKTVMTRCIHCTRCVRFAEEVAGVEEIGAVGRGENMQITTYLEQAATSELSGNVIDLCPVGALTSKPYAFESRPWELVKTNGIDVMDAVGSNVRYDSRGPQVLRVLPRVNDDVNEEWLSDKGRYGPLGLMKRRLDAPYIRENGKLRRATWKDAFAAVKRGLSGLGGEQIGAIAGDLVDVESMVALKDLLAQLGSSRHECRQDGAQLGGEISGVRASYLFNTGIAPLETADVVLLIGSNPRWEAPLVNTRIRKAVRRGAAKVFAIGPEVDLTYEAEWLGGDLTVLGSLPQAVVDALKGAERPAVIVGQGALARTDGAGVLAAVETLVRDFNLVRDGWNGFNVLHTAAGRVGGLDIGFTAEGGVSRILADAESGALKALFLHGADEIDAGALPGVFKIYVGHHGDRGVRHADVILPAASFAEKDATWVNMEGRVQRSNRAVFPPGDAREDWAIFRALSDVLGSPLGYDDMDALRARIAREFPLLADEGLAVVGWDSFSIPGRSEVQPEPVRYSFENYYMTNPVARASEVMQQCSEIILHGNEDVLEAAE